MEEGARPHATDNSSSSRHCEPGQHGAAHGPVNDAGLARSPQKDDGDDRASKAKVQLDIKSQTRHRTPSVAAGHDIEGSTVLLRQVFYDLQPVTFAFVLRWHIRRSVIDDDEFGGGFFLVRTNHSSCYGDRYRGFPVFECVAEQITQQGNGVVLGNVLRDDVVDLDDNLFLSRRPFLRHDSSRYFSEVGGLPTAVPARNVLAQPVGRPNACIQLGDRQLIKSTVHVAFDIRQAVRGSGIQLMKSVPTDSTQEIPCVMDSVLEFLQVA